MVAGVGAGRPNRAGGAVRGLVAGALEGVARALWGATNPPDPIFSPGWPGRVQRVVYVLFTAWTALLGIVALDTGAARGGGPEIVTAGWLFLAVHLVGIGLAMRRPLLGWRIAVPAMLVGAVLLPESSGPVTGSLPWRAASIGVLLGLVGLAHPARTAVAVGALTWLGLTAARALTPAPLDLFWTLVLPLLAGAVIGSRRRSRAALDVERERGAVLAERARIAREMHDVVAHHMSMIAVRCETAPYRLAGLPEPARAELAEVGAAARAAMTEMQALLGVLRATGHPVEHAPQPGIAQLDELLADARAAGTEVSWSVPVSADEVPDAVGLTAYRVVQQALTNAGQHAGGAPVTVAVSLAGGVLRIAVENGPGARSAPGGGRGLTGMRERVELHDGRFAAGPAPGGGFAVHAEIPVPTEEPAR